MEEQRQNLRVNTNKYMKESNGVYDHLGNISLPYLEENMNRKIKREQYLCHKIKERKKNIREVHTVYAQREKTKVNRVHEEPI